MGNIDSLLANIERVRSLANKIDKNTDKDLQKSINTYLLKNQNSFKKILEIYAKMPQDMLQEMYQTQPLERENFIKNREGTISHKKYGRILKNKNYKEFHSPYFTLEVGLYHTKNDLLRFHKVLKYTLTKLKKV